MKTFKTFAAGATLGVGMFLSIGAWVPVAQAAGVAQDRYRGAEDRFERGDRESRLRDVIDRTQSDLRDAASLDRRKGDENERYKDAQGHLSSFDRSLTKGKFNNSELNKSIDKIKEILDKNVLQASSRDMLLRDWTDLKVARAARN